MEKIFLTAETKKARMYLLLFSMIGFSFSQIGISIVNVSIFGIDIATKNIDAIPFILFLIILYFTITFFVFSLHEYSDSYRKYRHEYLTNIINGKNYSPKIIEAQIKEYELNSLSYKLKHESSPSIQEREELNKNIDEINSKIINLKKILKYHNESEPSLIEKINFDKLRLFIDLFLPVIVGLSVSVILLVYSNNHSSVINPQKYPSPSSQIKHIKQKVSADSLNNAK